MNYPADAIHSMLSALLDLDHAVGQLLKDDPSTEALGLLLTDISRLSEQLDVVYDQVAAHLEAAMKDLPEFVLADGTKIEKRTGLNRKTWQHSSLASEVARRLHDLSIDLDTGERLMTTQQMIVKVLDFVQPSYWRVKTLAEIGINADNFCEVSEGKTSIIIRKAK